MNDSPRRTAPFFQNPDLVQVPWYESPFLDGLIAHAAADAQTVQRIRQFSEDGYLIADLGVEDLDGVCERIKRDLGPLYPESNRRILDGWMIQEDVRALASLSSVRDVLFGLFGREPIPFQTLNFDRGTEQDTHSDTVHFHTIPAHFMCGVWMALEDIDDANGPLHYYPGSHRLKDYSFADIGLSPDVGHYGEYEVFVEALMEAHGLERREVHIKKGEALVWAANLFHGGCPIKDPRRTRHSQVTHYFFDNCVYYMPMSSDLALGELCPREVIHIGTGKIIPPRRLGEIVDVTSHKNHWRYPRPLPDFVSED